MPMVPVTAVDEKQKKSALEKFATGLGIATSLGQLGVMGQSLMSGGSSTSSESPMQKFLKKKSATSDYGVA